MDPDARPADHQVEASAHIGEQEGEVARLEVEMPKSELPLDRTAQKEQERGRARQPVQRKQLPVQVTSDNGIPIQGAVVCFVPATGQWPEIFTRTQAQLHADARRRGGEGLTDGHGLVELSVPLPLVHIYAWKDGGFGFASANRDLMDSGLPCVVRLEAGQELAVHLREADGAPAADVEVVLLRAQPTGRPMGPMQWSQQPLGLGITDREGVLHLRHLRTLRSLFDSRPSDGALGVPMMATRILGLEEELKPLDPAAPTASPLVWQLPPMGSVELVFPDRREVAVSSANIHRVTLDGRASWPSQLGRLYATGSERKLPWLVPRVGLGIQARAQVYLEGENRYTTFDGPKSPQEKVTVVLEPPPARPAVTGRWLANEGEPPQPQWVVLEGEAADGRPRPFRYHGTGKLSDGHFEFRIEIDAAGVGRALTNARIAIHRQGGEAAVARLGPLTLPSTGDLHLGDLRGESTPILAAGIVRLDGRPTAQANVTLFVDTGSAGPRRFLASCRTDDQGRFAVRGQDASASFLIQAQHGSAARMEPVEIRRGSESLQLELTSGTTLQALLVLPEAATTTARQGLPLLRLVPEGPPGSSSPVEMRSHTPLTTIPDGTLLRFHANGVGRAIYRIQVHVPGVALPIHESALDLREPGDGDPDVVQIDLRTLLHVVTVRFEDGVGTPIAGTPVMVSVGTPPDQAAQTVWASKVSLLLPRAGADVKVSDMFHLQQVPLPALRTDTVVRLLRTGSRPVTITFDAAGDAPPHAHVRLNLESAEGESLQQVVGMREGRATVQVPLGIQTRIVASLQSNRQQVVRLPSTIQPIGVDQDQVRLEVDAREWAAALAELGVH